MNAVKLCAIFVFVLLSMLDTARAEDIVATSSTPESAEQPTRIKLSCQLFELAGTKAKEFARDIIALDPPDPKIATAQAGGESVHYQVIGNTIELQKLVDSYQRQNILRVLAEPTLIAVNGCPAFFHAGGELSGLRSNMPTRSARATEFGTFIDAFPQLLDNHKIRIEVQAKLVELDLALGVRVKGQMVPGFRTRQVATSVEMELGKTLMLRGLQQTRNRIAVNPSVKLDQPLDNTELVMLLTATKL